MFTNSVGTEAFAPAARGNITLEWIYQEQTKETKKQKKGRKKKAKLGT